MTSGGGGVKATAEVSESALRLRDLLVPAAARVVDVVAPPDLKVGMVAQKLAMTGENLILNGGRGRDSLPS